MGQALWQPTQDHCVRRTNRSAWEAVGERIVLTCGESEISALVLLCLQNIYVTEMPHATALTIPLATANCSVPDGQLFLQRFRLSSFSPVLERKTKDPAVLERRRNLLTALKTKSKSTKLRKSLEIAVHGVQVGLPDHPSQSDGWYDWNWAEAKPSGDAIYRVK
jgi:hypothetical protein